MEIYQGPSMIDGEPIVGIVTTTTTNEKLVGPSQRHAPCLQLWILRADIHPADAVKTGEDKSICGECKFRAIRDLEQVQRLCYVSLNPIYSVFRTWMRGSYPVTTPGQAGARGRGATLLRLGAYGDPAALPIGVVRELAKSAAANGVWRRAGYTHQWRTCDEGFKSLVMASCDNASEHREAIARGWRAFTVEDSAPEGAILCPASTEGGKRTTCEKCGLCDGTGPRGDGKPDRHKSIWLPVHGAFKESKHENWQALKASLVNVDEPLRNFKEG